MMVGRKLENIPQLPTYPILPSLILYSSLSNDLLQVSHADFEDGLGWEYSRSPHALHILMLPSSHALHPYNTVLSGPHMQYFDLCSCQVGLLYL